MGTKIGIPVAQWLDVSNFVKDVPNFVKKCTKFCKWRTKVAKIRLVVGNDLQSLFEGL